MLPRKLQAQLHSLSFLRKNKRFLYENTENQSKYKGKKRNVRLG